MMMPRYSDSDSSAENEVLRERRTLIDFAQAVDEDEDEEEEEERQGRDDDVDGDDGDGDSDSDLNLTERNAEVTFDGSAVYEDDTDADGLASPSAAGAKSKTWANRLLRRALAKPANVDKKTHTLGHFKPSGFSRIRAESPTPQRSAREPRHFHLKRNRPTKPDVKPASQPVLRYRLCPYALPSLQEIHAHFGSELNSMNALPKSDVDDRNSKYSAVIAMHFQELAEVASTMHEESLTNDELPIRQSAITGLSISSPERRKSDPAKAATVSAIERAKMEMRHSEVTHRLEDHTLSRSLPNTTRSGFVFASIDDPVMLTFEEEDEEEAAAAAAAAAGADVDGYSNNLHEKRRQRSDDHRLLTRMSDLRSSFRTPPRKERVTESAPSLEDSMRPPATSPQPQPSTKTNRFRKIGQFRSKHSEESAGGTNGEAAASSPRTYTLAQLQAASGTLAGVDDLHKEDALSEEEFEKTFKCTRVHFKTLPQWRRNMLKKEYGLF